MHMAIAEALADAFCEFVEEMRVAVVDDRMDRVESQTVEMKLFQPIHRVVDEELADDLAGVTLGRRR